MSCHQADNKRAISAKLIECNQDPIIFVAHSLGGIILKDVRLGVVSHFDDIRY